MIIKYCCLITSVDGNCCAISGNKNINTLNNININKKEDERKMEVKMEIHDTGMDTTVNVIKNEQIHKLHNDKHQMSNEDQKHNSKDDYNSNTDVNTANIVNKSKNRNGNNVEKRANKKKRKKKNKNKSKNIGKLLGILYNNFCQKYKINLSSKDIIHEFCQRKNLFVWNPLFITNILNNYAIISKQDVKSIQQSIKSIKYLDNIVQPSLTQFCWMIRFWNVNDNNNTNFELIQKSRSFDFWLKKCVWRCCVNLRLIRVVKAKIKKGNVLSKSYVKYNTSRECVEQNGDSDHYYRLEILLTHLFGDFGNHTFDICVYFPNDDHDDARKTNSNNVLKLIKRLRHQYFIVNKKHTTNCFFIDIPSLIIDNQIHKDERGNQFFSIIVKLCDSLSNV